MTLTELIQIKQDRLNGIMICRPTIDKLILHAVMRECEAPHLRNRIQNLETELRETKALLDMATNKGDPNEHNR